MRQPLTVLLREAPLLLAIFLDLAGFGMVIPDVQTRLESFGAHGGTIGLILSSYFLVQIVVSPQWGRVSDRVGRKPVLVACGFLSAVSMVVYAFAHSLPLVLASRVLAGFAAANTVVAQAYIADVNPDDSERAAAMGRVGAAITAGLMLGPALGGWLAGVGGNHLLGLVAAGASGAGALWLLFALPTVAPVAPIVPAQVTTIVSVSRTRWHGLSLLRDAPRLRPLLVLAAVSLLALACLEGTFGRLIHRQLGFGPREFGMIFSYEALLGFLVQSTFLTWVTKRLSPRHLLRVGFVLQGAGLALTPFAPNLIALFGCSTFYGLGAGVANPTLSAQCSAATPLDRQGEMFGLLQMARSAGFLVGPILGGLLFDWHPAVPYLLAGTALLIASFLTSNLPRRKPSS